MAIKEFDCVIIDTEEKLNNEQFMIMEAMKKVKRIYQDMADTYNRQIRPRGRGKSKKKNAQL